VDEYQRANQVIWNAWATHSLESEHHKDVARFRAGELSLRPIEREELGDVASKSLLHLLCNLGSDTLSWARLGANVTGVDFSERAIEQARALAREAQLDARFICSDLYGLPGVLDEPFDIVFTSYGVLCWMPDLQGWANTLARYVKRGGVFYMVEMHPATNCMRPVPNDGAGARFQVASPYFHTADPMREEVAIADGETESRTTLYAWSYGLGEVISALIAAGLHIEFVHEFPVAFYQRFGSLVRGDGGLWRWPSPENTLPLLFSVRARKY
jgi:SAM-dependent methyltransferase